MHLGLVLGFFFPITVEDENFFLLLRKRVIIIIL